MISPPYRNLTLIPCRSVTPMAAGGVPERHNFPPAPPRKLSSGQPWSHIETIHLIDAYEERWRALKRGQLKAHQWEEVAATVATRCGLRGAPGKPPAKTGTQCRHKMEKLRKRYRAERLRPDPSVWPYFDRMDRMERGPLPLSVRPPAQTPSRPSASAAGRPSTDDEDEEEEDEEEDEDQIESVNGILGNVNWGSCRASSNPSSRKRRDFEAEEEEESDEDEEKKGLSQAVSEMAAVVRRFGDGMMRMEKRRMEMMREIERDWMEMETKRAEMVMESQRCLVEMIAGAFASAKSSNKSQNL